MKINRKKTNILRRNTTREIPIMPAEEKLEQVETFRYLDICSTVDTSGWTENVVKTRISKAFHILRNVWKSRVIGKTTTIRLFNTKLMSSRSCYVEQKHGE